MPFCSQFPHLPAMIMMVFHRLGWTMVGAKWGNESRRSEQLLARNKPLINDIYIPVGPILMIWSSVYELLMSPALIPPLSPAEVICFGDLHTPFGSPVLISELSCPTQPATLPPPLQTIPAVIFIPIEKAILFFHFFQDENKFNLDVITKFYFSH